MSDDIRDRAEATAREVFGWEALHAGQAEAIEAVVGGRDTLAVMPTGYGKSGIYQVAGLLIDGPTVVVSPLIALQDDQVAGLEAREQTGGPRAVAVNSTRSAGEVEQAWADLASGDAEYVFLAPEQLAKDEVVERLLDLGVRLFVVDEAHCVSSWGHDFRPDYLVLGEVVERLGHPTVLAMTATGSGPVRSEIVERLAMRDPLELSRGFDRPNLRLEVVRHSDDDGKRAAVVEQVATLPVPGLLYVATRKETEWYADELADRGRNVRAYHAGLKASERQEVHEAFLAGTLDVVVATNAFGMGIDKPDVRFVVHADVPESVDAYYQEIGRAGRDGDPATTTLHYRAEDLGLRRFFASGTPAKAKLRTVFDAVPDDGAIRRPELAEAAEVPTRSLGRYANALVEGGALEETEDGLVRTDDDAARDADAAADAAVARAEDRERIEESRIAMMRQYAETLGCRRQFLLGYFGDELPQPCGNCDTCASGSAYAQDAHVADGSNDAAYPPDSEVEHDEWGHGTVMSTEEDRITVFFESVGYRVLSIDAVRERGLLRTV
ncbi:RecQ family ATP-dependent DNA helicase [Curtobacterium sp. MCBD17_028]|uniref:RecQ family ATP-dependent DNA helicase n=1 Tax=Curtobacterium sp. MCBD17_028 TaxID=2175670 RepID=UPI000DA791BD|nr:RecQ family ATP-dependent DNA helicase [Curtobacterium sp. MCBD17_028]PZE28035.1 recombinase RecQ [Curtobacterium sp. MCBD17_028]